MAPSSSSRAARLLMLADRTALAGLTLGLSLYVMPFWREGRLRWAFWITLIATFLHVYTSQRRSREVP